MPQVRWLLYRLKSLWRRDAREAELEAELQFHLEAEAAEQMEAGVPADRARQAARRALGNVTLAKEDARAVWNWGAVERILQDVRYAGRVLARQPSFTATALATIVLIVGGTTAVFTLVNSVLLKPLPYPASNRLLIVPAFDARGGIGMNYRDVESAAVVVNDGGPLSGGDISLGGVVPEGQTGGQGRGFSVSLRGVSGAYFNTLGIPILSGRPILDSDISSSDGVVVLNQAAAGVLWPGENPLGKRLGGFGRRMTVVGIVPDFKLTRLDGKVSLQMYSPVLQLPTGAQTSAIMLRAKPGARAITNRTKAILVNLEKDTRVDVLAMAQVRWKLLASERFRTAVLLVFAGTATFLALIGIFGLVSYTVAQRQREIGLRVALGATYSRVVSLMLRQALIPAILGIVAGIVGAVWASRLLSAFLFGVQATDPATFGAAIGLFLCAVFLAALLPALRSFRVDPASALRHD